MEIYDTLPDCQRTAGIIAIGKYDDVEYDRSNVSDDVRAISRTLSRSNFETIEKKEGYVTLHDAQRFIQDLVDGDREQNRDMIFLAIFTHGCNENMLLFSDMTTISFFDLIKPITQSPTYRGKPKIFVVQACRSRGPDGSGFPHRPFVTERTQRTFAKEPKKNCCFRLKRLLCRPKAATNDLERDFYIRHEDKYSTSSSVNYTQSLMTRQANVVKEIQKSHSRENLQLLTDASINTMAQQKPILHGREKHERTEISSRQGSEMALSVPVPHLLSNYLENVRISFFSEPWSKFERVRTVVGLRATLVVCSRIPVIQTSVGRVTRY